MEGICNPYSENIECFIEFINDLATEIYYENLMCNGKTLFQCGACYEFVKIIKEYFDIDNILIEKNFQHCAIEYKGNYYDSLGIIENKENFSVATDEDIMYIRDRFGIHLKKYKIFETIVDEVARIENVPYLPNRFYQNKIKCNTKNKSKKYCC